MTAAGHHMPLRDSLERLYFLLNRRSCVDPDPLLFLYRYSEPLDLELSAFLASSLAYGRVSGIMKSIACLLELLGKHPASQLKSMTEKQLAGFCPDFKHRFTDGRDISSFLRGIRRTWEEYGSLENALLSCMNPADADLLNGMNGLVRLLSRDFPDGENFLLPSPERGSACKRLFLCLRWLVRKDAVDLGLWSRISPSKLIVPLDTHMFRISRELGMTQRQTASLRSAYEITNSFRKISPDDPVKYDFTLTRFGIHPEIHKMTWSDLL